VLSIGATIRLIDEGFGGDLSASDLAITRNNFGNALLHAGINPGARQAFENAVDALKRGKNTRTDPELMYQLAHSFAGIGYTYYNEANAAEQKTGTKAVPAAGHWLARVVNATKPQHDHARDALRHADRWLSKALEALRESHDDRWTDARIWACSARVCSRLGNTTETHRRFARALLAGHERWRANSEELAEFFNPDFDTRLKYMEAFEDAGGTGAAVILAKAAVHAVHKFSLPDVDRDHARDYVLSRSNVHRKLIENLSCSGRHNEAEQAYDLLKLDIHSEYAQRSLDMIDVEAMVGLTKAEREALQSSGIAAILDAVRDVTDEAAAVSLSDKLAAAFQKLSPAIEDRLRAHSKAAAQDDERRLRELSERLGPRAALIRYLIAEDSAQIVAVCNGRRTVQAVNAKQRDISIWVFELRQRCRHPRAGTYNEFLRLSKLLYDSLVAPVYSIVHGQADTLYVQLDQPLTGMPFGALHNGSSFVTEEFSIVLLNRAGQAAGPNEPPAASTRKQVSIFLCSDLPGAELPGAGREGDAVRAGLTAAGGPFMAQVYAHDDCTAETFIAAMGEPGRQRGAIHLATHANFNATNDRLSVLSFHDDGAISVRRLRDLLEARPCDAGLFVLSACGTARQDVDVEGFSVTLLRAGVTSVLATLWESLDFSAPEFFESFYGHCADLGSPRAVAQGIQAAQRKCRSSQADVGGIPLWHPAHWAPYAVTTGRI
jgi:CHAT domain-containing protein